MSATSEATITCKLLHQNFSHGCNEALDIIRRKQSVLGLSHRSFKRHDCPCIICTTTKMTHPPTLLLLTARTISFGLSQLPEKVLLLIFWATSLVYLAKRTSAFSVFMMMRMEHYLIALTSFIFSPSIILPWKPLATMHPFSMERLIDLIVPSLLWLELCY